MTRLLISVLFCALIVAPALAVDAPAQTEPEPIRVMSGAEGLLHSSGTANGLAARETTGPDTFVLYGGPGHPTEGKFQLADGVTADWGGGNGLPGGYGGGPDAWTPVDLTMDPVYWDVSTFNAENLNNNGPGNLAMWCGLAADDPRASEWTAAPGYGNSWYEGLIYESEPLADPSIGQVVDLEFYFNQEAEPGYDFFAVQYDSAGTWVQVMRNDAYSSPGPPGTLYSDVAERPIEFSGNDYGQSEVFGGGYDRIRIRLLFQSDYAWSNEDGLWPTEFGAVQVDDITLTTSQGSFFEDFEGSDPYLFNPHQTQFFGDFADVYPRFSDIDPCRENQTPVVGFLDYDQVVRNGPGVDGRVSTGGSTEPGYEYGIPGNWVNNHNGGLSAYSGFMYLENEIWSPDIEFDVPGPGDDGLEFAGMFIRFDVWSHLPLTHANFYQWHVRSAVPGETYGSWKDRSFVYYGGGLPLWNEVSFDVSDLIQPGAERVQVALGALDYSSVCWGGCYGASPAPIFDNVAVYKYRLPGPTFTTRTIDLAQDGFPVNGSTDASTPASRDALDIPFSMARDVNAGGVMNVAGDSITVDATAIIPGTEATDIRMVWALQTNPLFEDVLRSAPTRTEDENVVAGPSGTVWTGGVVADTSKTSWGSIVEDRFFTDLPDVDFMYPGDVLHYYFQATDSDGRISTMPHDISGFGVFGPDSPYDRTFTVRGLPTITDTAGSQPDILVINDFGRRGAEDEFLTSFRNLGYFEGVHHDTYTVMGPTSGVGNGIGSAGTHGATGAQLAGYEHMFYFGGNLSALLLSNGTNVGNNDKGNDIGTLEQWHALAGTRNIAYFGDYIAHALEGDSFEGYTYLANTMGVEYIDQNVSDAIDDQLTPVVTPSPYGATWFATDFVASGGCLAINEFDQIQPLAGAQAGHYFTSTGGIPFTGPAASVIHPTPNGVDITFPYSIMFIENVLSRDAGVSPRTQVFSEVLGLFSAGAGGVPVAALAPEVIALSALPNPFNPATVVKFTAPIGSKGSVKVFNLRGELVRTLHSGEFRTQEFRWDGADAHGASVASGIYVVRAETEGKAQSKKVALVK